MKWKKQGTAVNGHTYFGSYLENGMHQVLGRLNGRGGCYSWLGTNQLILKLKKFDPDIIHLHNLHNCYVNVKMLFRYIKKYNKKVVWTLHDCWGFTGKCPHFLCNGCEKWKSGCDNCTALSEYPISTVDATKIMWRKKRQWYGNVSHLTIVTPSQWLASVVRQSFLKGNKVVVINNGINLDVFRPTTSDFRKENGLEEQKIVLGVSFGWSTKKGLEDMVRLSVDLPGNYRVVLIGVDDSIKKDLPERIVALGRTSSMEELAGVYSAANVFVNLTKEDTFPTVNIESIACGTPVITLNTGGSGEMLDANSGIIVDSYERMLVEILNVCENDMFSEYACVRRAQDFSDHNCVEKYLSLYESC